MRTVDEAVKELFGGQLSMHLNDYEVSDFITADRREVQLALLDEIDKRLPPCSCTCVLVTEDLRAQLQQDDGKRPLESAGGIGGE